MRRRTRLAVETFEERINLSPSVTSVTAEFLRGDVPGASATVFVTIDEPGSDRDKGTDTLQVSMGGVNLLKDNFTVKVNCPGCSGGMMMTDGKELLRYRVTLPLMNLDTQVLAPGSYSMDVAFTGDFNMQGSSAQYAYSYQFGNVPDPNVSGANLKNVVLNAVEDGQPLEFSLRGNGTGTVVAGGVPSITLANTDANSDAAVTGAGTFSGVTANSTLGSLTMAKSYLAGTSSFSGGLSAINLYRLGIYPDGSTPGATMTIAAGGDSKDRADDISIAAIFDAKINDADPIKNFLTGAWVGGSQSANSLSAPSVSQLRTQKSFPGDKLQYSGRFMASLSLGSLGTATIAGMASNAATADVPDAWNITGAVKSISVGTISNVTINSASIAGFKVTTVSTAGSYSFDQTSITTGLLGVVSLRDVAPTTTGATFGINAQAIGHYLRYAGKKLAASSAGLGGLTNPGAYDQLPDSNGDFRITIL
jgi:hypothetical protein